MWIKMVGFMPTGVEVLHFTCRRVDNMLRSMNYNIDEYRLIFVKTGLEQFLRFTENRSVTIQKIKI
jgi:hypothetical protein